MTICDIAKKAGVSIATVSRVINGNGYVKEETKKKVEAVISESNYSPNEAARNLIKKESSAIGFIMPERINPFCTNIIDGVERRADENNLDVIFYNTSEDQDKEHRALKAMMGKQIKGLLIMPILHSDAHTRELLEKIEESGIPVVLIDRDLEEGDFDAVFIDNKGAVYEGAKALAEAGHKKIAVITCPEVTRPGFTRLDGYLKCLDEYQIPHISDYIYYGDFMQESGYMACEKLMSLPEPPTAVLATSSSETLGCIRYFNEHDMNLGEDISLIGFDDIATLNIIGYQITIIDRPMREMGEMAFEILMERASNPRSKKRSREIILQTKLILRGSEQKAKAADSGR